MGKASCGWVDDDILFSWMSVIYGKLNSGWSNLDQDKHLFLISNLLLNFKLAWCFFSGALMFPNDSLSDNCKTNSHIWSSDRILVVIIVCQRNKNRKCIVSVKIIGLNFVTFHKAKSHLAKVECGIMQFQIFTHKTFCCPILRGLWIKKQNC